MAHVHNLGVGVEETAQYSAIASLFLFLGLAANAFTNAGRTTLEDSWRKAGSGSGKGTSPTGVIIGYIIMGVFYSTAASFAAYVAYIVSTRSLVYSDSATSPEVSTSSPRPQTRTDWNTQHLHNSIG